MGVQEEYVVLIPDGVDLEEDIVFVVSFRIEFIFGVIK